MGLQRYDGHVPRTAGRILDIASGTTVLGLSGGEPPGVRVNSLTATSTSVNPHDLNIHYLTATLDLLIGTISIPAGAGATSAVPPVDILAFLATIIPDVILTLDDAIAVALAVALGANEEIHVLALGCAF